ncbi:hypothetical protein PG994_000617 [Apiospora phragmitis]|uniref:Uncharacterized protein n=1 Tax=Apiospora phragmitis TaxID=2905665 RepID=A0ABR1X711_9PEZI
MQGLQKCRQRQRECALRPAPSERCGYAVHMPCAPHHRDINSPMRTRFALARIPQVGASSSCT